MTNLRFSNKSFLRTVKAVRKILPVLAILLLILVYSVAALAAGALLSALMAGVAHGALLAYSIGISIQATRGLLVFLPIVLNPGRPVLSYTGEFIAILMGLVAIAEVIGLVFASNLAVPVAVSLSILMVAGVGIELFLLREIRFTTELEMFSDRQHWQNVVDYHKERAKFEMMLEQLEFEVENYRPYLEEKHSHPLVVEKKEHHPPIQEQETEQGGYQGNGEFGVTE